MSKPRRLAVMDQIARVYKFQSANAPRKHLIRPALQSRNQITQSRSSVFQKGAQRQLSQSLNTVTISPTLNFLTYKIIEGNNSEVVERILLRREGWLKSNPRLPLTPNFRWCHRQKAIDYNELKNSMKNRKIVNLFPKAREIGCKSYLTKNLANYWSTKRLNQFDIVPLTYVFNKSSPTAINRQANDFLRIFRSIPNSTQPGLWSGRNIWIFKPARLSRGRGIECFESESHFHRLVEKFAGDTFLLQKYIEKPLLYNGRKFDIRQWILLTHDKKAYFCREGYLRLSTEEYTLENLSNDIHVTNNAIQQNKNQYSAYEVGNQLSTQQFQDYLDSTGQDWNYTQKLYPAIKSLIRTTINSVYGKLDPTNARSSFQLLGADFMIDETYRPWLIEINASPCMDEESPYFSQLLPKMLDDAFRLTIDQIFRVQAPMYSEDTSLLSTPSTENIWDYVADFK